MGIIKEKHLVGGGGGKAGKVGKVAAVAVAAFYVAPIVAGSGAASAFGTGAAKVAGSLAIARIASGRGQAQVIQDDTSNLNGLSDNTRLPYDGMDYNPVASGLSGQTNKAPAFGANANTADSGQPGGQPSAFKLDWKMLAIGAFGLVLAVALVKK